MPGLGAPPSVIREYKVNRVQAYPPVSHRVCPVFPTVLSYLPSSPLTMRSSFAAILAVISVALAAPATLVAKQEIGLAVFCTDINFEGDCVEVESQPFHGQGGCANLAAPYIDSISSARGVTDGYTCFLYSGLDCTGSSLVVSGQIPDFLAASVNFNDKAVSWSCGSVV
ncbi:hypothetical protein K438DRAFT_1976736 [Mycena galopus ATCC 62051]|nr:hypothetical protein K438DRAFT_1976736 [Mycena galopus ATCC 62051]